MQGGKTTAIRTFELDVTVSAPLVGEFDDWPNNIKDGILAALERLAHSVMLPLAIVHARCDVDWDVPEDAPGRYFVHVIASEVVMADPRNLSRDRVIKELPEDVRRLLN